MLDDGGNCAGAGVNFQGLDCIFPAQQHRVVMSASENRFSNPKMNSDQGAAQRIRRDFAFFVRGIPEAMMVRHPQYTFTFVGVCENEKKLLIQFSEQSPAVANWLRGAAGRYCIAILRNEHADEADGFSEAFERLSGILDGYAFLAEDTTPEVCPLVVVRERDEPDASIKLFGNRAALEWGSPSESAEQAWQSRKAQLLQRFLIFFEAVAGEDPQFDTEVVNQVALSAKMFRHGCKSETYGIEFLCKFTALEGLVCGPRKNGHGPLLKQRLPSLFRTRNNINAEVAKLWTMRCGASHQGKAFSSEFSSVIEPLERLALGVMIFALDNLASVKTIDELWAMAPSYSLPPEVMMERPKTRVPVIHMMSHEVAKWIGAGHLTEIVFSQLGKPVTG